MRANHLPQKVGLRNGFGSAKSVIYVHFVLSQRLSQSQPPCKRMYGAGTNWVRPRQQVAVTGHWPAKHDPWEKWVPWLVDSFLTPTGYEVERCGIKAHVKFVKYLR
jgi:hypothetical protein